MLHDHGGDVVGHRPARRRSVSGSYPAPLPAVRSASTARGSTPADTSTRVAARADRHVHGFHEGGRAVVERRVGDLEPGELADHRLVLEEDLQHALGELGLVRACTRCRTRCVPRAPTRPRARSGRRRRRRRSRSRSSALRLRAASERRSAASSISLTPSAIASGRSSRTDAGICVKSSSIEERPTAASISRISSSVCGLNLTSRQCTEVPRPMPRPTGGGVRTSSRPYFATSDR